MLLVSSIGKKREWLLVLCLLAVSSVTGVLVYSGWNQWQTLKLMWRLEEMGQAGGDLDLEIDITLSLLKRNLKPQWRRSANHSLASLHIMKSREHRAAGRNEEAAQQLDLAIGTREQLGSTFAEYANLLLDSDRLDAAIVMLERAEFWAHKEGLLDHLPLSNRSELYGRFARVFLEQGDEPRSAIFFVNSRVSELLDNTSWPEKSFEVQLEDFADFVGVESSSIQEATREELRTRTQLVSSDRL